MQLKIFKNTAAHSSLLGATVVYEGGDQEKSWKMESQRQEKHMSIPQSRNRLHIAYLTELDPFDRGNWSGGLYYVRRALQEYCGDVTCIGPLTSHEPSLLSRSWAKNSVTLLNKPYLQRINLTRA